MLRVLKALALTGLPFGIVMGLLIALMSGRPLGYALASGLACGLCFGLSLVAFTEWQRSRFSKYGSDLDGEPLIKQGPANHFRGMESVGGWLYLTDRRLLFRSHRFNVRNHELSVPLGEVQEVRASVTAWVIPNGLRITTAHGQERFVVEGRRSWVEAISRAAEGPTTPESSVMHSR